MIDPHHIIQPIAVGDAADPPGIARLPMVLPTIQRVAPQLPGDAERIRRTARHADGHIVLIQLKKFRIGPGIRAVKGHIDRNVPHNTDALLVGISLQCFPLGSKQVLLELIETDLLRQFFPVFFQSPWLSQADVLIPFHPAHILKMALHCHVQGIIRQPVLILLCKLQIVLLLQQAVLSRPFVGNAQKFESGEPDFLIIHIGGIAAVVHGLALLLRQITLPDQCLQINIVGIARKGGERLIRGIPIAGGPQGQNLP